MNHSAYRYCPVGDLPKYDTLDEQKYVESREAVFKTITPTLQGLQSLWDIWTPDERNFRVREIMVVSIYFIPMQSPEKLLNLRNNKHRNRCVTK